MTSGIITHIQRFSVHDGPGIRTTVFLKGCQMHCPWCHNPETYRPEPELQIFGGRCIGCGACSDRCEHGAHAIVDGRHVFHRERCVGCGHCAEVCYAQSRVLVGRTKTARQVADEVLADRAFYQSSGGGVTISGGEPLAQAKFTQAILELCKREGIPTAIETNLAWPWSHVALVAPSVDLFLVDLKLLDDAEHRAWTGVSNQHTLDNLRRLDAQHIPVIVRTPIIGGVNDHSDQIDAIADWLASLSNMLYYELLPYHPLGRSKHEALGMAPPRESFQSPPAARLEQLADCARWRAITVRVAGVTTGCPDDKSAYRGNRKPCPVAPTLPQGLSYAARLEHLRKMKEVQTQEKLRKLGYMNEDDYGLVLPPETSCWQPTPNHPNGSFYGLDGWSKNFCSLMDCHPVYVDPMDALAGRYMYLLNRLRTSNWPPEYDYSELKPEQERYGIISGIGNDAHFAPDYRIGLELGWGGLLAKVRRFRGQHGPEKAAFFQAEEDVILGIQGWIRRTVTAIEEAHSRESDPTLRENLREMADANRWLIDGPPRTLREACQWLAWFNMASRTYNRDGAGGQLDALLWPYYQRDLRDGRIDDEGAIFLLACLLLNDTRYYQLGGPDAQGRDQTNPLSLLILEASHRLGSTCNLTIRVHDGLDPHLLRKGVETLLQDRKGCPRFSGDKALVEGFMRNGYTTELARQRIAVGCNWMALPGLEYTMNDTVKINVAKVFTVAFAEMMATDVVEPSTGELWRRFENHLGRAVLCTARGIDHQLDHQHLNEPELLLNLLTHGPIERGLNVTNGGVDLYNMCIDGAGLATVADSLAALQQRIEQQQTLTWKEISQHLENNYAGRDGERVRLMMHTGPHFGEGDSLGDRWAGKLSRLLTRLVKERPTPGGRNMIPGWFSWADTIRLGRQVTATPDGRRAGEPISHGANPRPGCRSDGAATAMVKAVATVQPGYGNTAPIQLELDPGVADSDHAADIVTSLITTHFELGGTLFNINIVDADRLLEAHKDPAQFPDLVVRVTGFTAYFASLSPEFRQLVVDRVMRG